MSKMFDHSLGRAAREERADQEKTEIEKPQVEKPRIDDGEIEKRVAKRAREYPSATRSDKLVAALWKRGLDEEGIAQRLVEATEATTTRRSWRYSKEKHKMEAFEEQVPDWKVRISALDLMTRVHGFLFQLPKDTSVNINVSTLRIAQDVDRMTVDQLMKEYPNAVATLGAIRPDLVDKIEEAEVVPGEDADVVS